MMNIPTSTVSISVTGIQINLEVVIKSVTLFGLEKIF